VKLNPVMWWVGTHIPTHSSSPRPCIMPSFPPSSAHDCLFVCLFGWLVCLFIHPASHHRLLFDIFWQSIVINDFTTSAFASTCLVLLIWIMNQQSVQVKTCPSMHIVQQFQIPSHPHRNTCCCKKKSLLNSLDEIPWMNQHPH